MKRLFILSILLLSFSISACVTSGNAKMSRADELRIGAQEHPKLIKEFGGAYMDPKLRDYIRSIGLKLVQHTDKSGLAYTFTILNTDKINALSLPGGYVYVTRGLLALAGNEAEVAGVLAHEIGHVTARHTKQRYEKDDKDFSEMHELEADTLGVHNMVLAGYDPNTVTSFLHKMKAHGNLERVMAGNTEDTSINAHPRTSESIKKVIDKEIKAAANDAVELRRNEYLDQIDGMVFGDDPEQGLRRGREFIHPELRIRYEVPPGFVLFNSPPQVIARGPKSSVIVFDLAREKSASEARSLRDYISNTWASGLSLSGLESIFINGMEAATTSGSINTESGPKDLKLVAIRGGADKIYRLSFITSPEVTEKLSLDFQHAINSFRRLTKEEADGVKPLRIKIVTAKPNDTVASLSAGFPFERHKQDWFRLLNGLNSDDEIKLGKRMKMVVSGGTKKYSAGLTQPTDTVRERLRKLKEIHDDGLINDDEYKKKKDALLNQL